MAAKALLDRGLDFFSTLQEFWVAAGYAADTIRIAGVMETEDKLRVAQSPALNDPAIYTQIVETVTRNLDRGLWKGLLEVLEFMPEETQAGVLQVIAQADSTALQVHAFNLSELGLWPPLLRTLAKQNVEVQRVIAEAWVPFITPRDRRAIDELVVSQGMQDKLDFRKIFGV